MKKQTYKLIKIICMLFLNIGRHTYVIGLVMKRIHNLLKNNGTLFTVKYLKQARLHVTRYYCGSPLMENNIGVSLTQTGFPIIFKECEPLIKGSMNLKKFVFTLINISRTIRPRKGEIIPISLKPITDPSTAVINKLDNRLLRKVISQNDICLSIPDHGLSDLELTTKSGPHGPQTLTALYSMKRYSTATASAIMGMLSTSLFKYFKDLYQYSLSKPDEVKPCGCKAAPEVRRLSIVKDPECKMRVIGMFDWWSQVTLKPLSDSLFKALSKIDSDRTYSQDPAFHFEVDTNLLWSIDLTAATDRFPIELQKQILSILTNTAFTRDWADVMVGEEFSYEGGSISYRVGQPMGAYSSWPMFTLSHHILVRYCGLLNGIDNFNRYIMLGDDIVINHNKVAKTYIRLLHALGVETSQAKTHVSKHTYEFAKRWIDTRCGEITGLPIKGLLDNIENMSTCFQILFDWQLKGNKFWTDRSLVESVADFLYKVQDFSKKPYGYRKILETLKPISFFMRLRFSLSTPDEVRNQICLWTRNSQFIVGGAEKLILNEVLRVFNLTYSALVQKSSRLIVEFYHRINEFVELEDNIIEDHVHPILQCIENHLERIAEKQESQRGDLTLKEMCDTLMLMDIESIMTQKRTKVQIMVNNTKMAHKFVNLVKSWDHDNPRFSDPQNFFHGGAADIGFGSTSVQQTLDRFRRYFL
ncbi:Pol [Sclerotinia sclerotiorum mitovirus 6]|uniref:Pol n=2 Tax=Mitoviridae TaxID=2732892 RepID=A0A023J4K6_9VIRU|nr:Pol [Sclerotinia sclerotiorum mitovirus 6]AHE13868.1 Pol [Sclerotinia sclerotiorum mitovirus 6]AHF48624.1 RNA-dependent RNA polymerase [Sclerotinia sclerotiorum mitovirus 8]